MNVLFLSELFYPHGGGAELATYLFAKILNDAEFNVIAVTNRFDGEPEVSRNEHQKIYRIPFFKSESSVKYSVLRRFDVLFSSFMRKMLNWADIVYIPRFWFSAIPLAKIYGKPIVTHLHDYIPICPLSTFYNMSCDAICRDQNRLCSTRCIYKYEKALGRRRIEVLASTILNPIMRHYMSNALKLSNVIVCVSEPQMNTIKEKMPHLGRKIELIHNPVPNVSHLSVEGQDFGYFGGPNHLKGFHVLCRALGLLKKRNKEAVTIHATKFFNTKTKLYEMAVRLGFVLYKKLAPPEYEKLYKRLCAVIVPSVWIEPWGYVVIEALLRGRFVIGSDIGGVPQQFAGCKGVVLCEPGNSKDLADAIEYVGSLSKEQVVDLGIQNRETFLKRIRKESATKNFVKIFEDLL